MGTNDTFETICSIKEIFGELGGPSRKALPNTKALKGASNNARKKETVQIGS
jgi:hypothetical protein